MARPSKRQHFAIYQDADAGTPTPSRHDPAWQPSVDSTPTYLPSFENDDVCYEQDEEYDGDELDSEDTALEDNDEATERANIVPADTEIEDARRASAITSASISSFPDSSFETDMERSLPMYQPHSSPMTRPSFRRPESVRRLQMSSPIPFERSPRRPVLHSRSRTGTPRTARVSAKGNPLHRRHLSRGEAEDEKKQYPLILLHVTLLPVELRWSVESVQAILPAGILENLQLLRSKASETIVQRGILIPHPREEYELLEERLLEALELKKERITKCGHFRARDSTSSTSSAEDSVRSGDSGLGSSIVGDQCETCHRRVQSVDSGVGTGKQKWSIKVYAANGLMRASAWAAAWSEMERVDVEILPWISEDLRRQLDAALLAEETVVRRKDKEVRIARVAEEQARHTHEQMLADGDATRRQREEAVQRKAAHLSDEASLVSRDSDTLLVERTAPSDLPQIYPSDDIPVSLLLKNYLLLLAQDKRNLLAFGLSVLAVLLALRTALAPAAVDFTPLPPVLDDSAAHDRALVDSLQDGLSASITRDLFQGLQSHSDVSKSLHDPSIPTSSTEVEQLPETTGVPAMPGKHQSPSVNTPGSDLAIDTVDVVPHPEVQQQIEIDSSRNSIHVAETFPTDIVRGSEEPPVDEQQNSDAVEGKDHAAGLAIQERSLVCSNPMLPLLLFEAPSQYSNASEV